jgi:ankyrin repeat protein
VNSLESMELVVAAGAEIDTRNTQGQTPLMTQSRQQGALSLVRFLLDHGAEVNARDTESKTAFTYVLTLKQYGHQIDSQALEAMIALLQERGGTV